MNLPVPSSSNSNSSGFSLLELAIVLIILGILGGMGLPLLTAQMSRAALLKTRGHQEYALHALAAYVEKNGRLPCPADPRATGPQYGIEQVQCRGAKAKGILPFKSLGISESFAKDGYYHFITYVVDQELAKKDTDIHVQEGGLITVKNEEGLSVLAPTKEGDKNPNYIALVLISHGKSGHGAWAREGSLSKMMGESDGPLKKENYDDNFIFIDSRHIEDTLRWETRDQFLKHYVGKRWKD